MQYLNKFAASILLIILSTTCTTAWSESDKIELVVSGKSISPKTSARIIDGSAYIPLEVLDSFWAIYSLDGKPKNDVQKIKIQPAGRDKFTASGKIIDNRTFLKVSDIADQMGITTQWNSEKRTLTFRAKIDEITFNGKELCVSTSYPITVNLLDTNWTRTNNKIILDMTGVHLPKAKSDLKIENSTNIPLNTGIQKDGVTARIVLDMPSAVKHRLTSSTHSSKIIVSLSEIKTEETKPDHEYTDGEDSESPSALTEQPKPILPPAHIKEIKYYKRGANRIEVRLSSNREVEYKTYMYRNPDRFIVDISNAEIEKELKNQDVDHEMLHGIRIGQNEDKTVRIVMDLSRIVVPYMAHDSEGITISMEMPKGAGGSLAEKVIVIDPGHGGKFKGATSCNGKAEKDYNLELSTQLQKSLKEAGAVALMTRTTDIALAPTIRADLEERVAFAVRHSADLLVSIHHNSCQVQGSISGTETFYHRANLNGRALAQCIHPEVIKAAGLPDRKMKPDPGSGFIVLKLSSEKGIPAILIEVGFINHPQDEPIVNDPSNQQDIAKAIVRGLKAYIEGNNKTDITQTEQEESPSQEINIEL